MKYYLKFQPRIYIVLNANKNVKPKVKYYTKLRKIVITKFKINLYSKPFRRKIII